MDTQLLVDLVSLIEHNHNPTQGSIAAQLRSTLERMGKLPTPPRRRRAKPDLYSIAHPCAASPTGWAEVHDDFDGDLDVVERLTAAELLAHPLVRVLGAEQAEEAERVAGE